MAQFGEGLGRRHLLAHRHMRAVDLDLADAEMRLSMAARGALEDLGSRRDRAAHAGIRGRDEGMAEDMPERLCHQARGRDHGGMQIEEMIEHDNPFV